MPDAIKAGAGKSGKVRRLNFLRFYPKELAGKVGAAFASRTTVPIGKDCQI